MKAQAASFILFVISCLSFYYTNIKTEDWKNTCSDFTIKIILPSLIISILGYSIIVASGGSWKPWNSGARSRELLTEPFEKIESAIPIPTWASQDIKPSFGNSVS